MPKIITTILCSILILALLIFCTSLIERYSILTMVDYKLLVVIAIWIIAFWLGFLLITELKSYNKPDSLIRKIIDKLNFFGPSFPSLLDVPMIMAFGMVMPVPMSAIILETIGWEYKNFLIPPGVIIGLAMSWASISLLAIEAHKKEWSALIHPETESKDHKSSRKRLLRIIVLLCTFCYIFTFVILIGLIGQEYLTIIILLGILAGLGVIYYVRYHFAFVISLVGVPESMAPSTKSKENKSTLKKKRKILREYILSHPYNKLSIKQLNRRTLGQLQKILKELSEVHKNDRKFIASLENTAEIKNKLIEPIEITPEIKEEISCINCNHTQQRSATELCSNCGLNIYEKVEYQTCTNCGSEYQTGLANCPIC